MIGDAEVYVALLDEAVEAWRPVRAERIGDNTYRILIQPYDRSIESWEFEPGDVVLCETVDVAGGRILAARSKVAGT